MVTVDSKGRVVIPRAVRERLGITPGTEVTIHEAGGKAVVEPEDDPERIIERMNRLVAESASDRGETTPADDEGETTPADEAVDPISRAHRDAVRKGTTGNGDE